MSAQEKTAGGLSRRNLWAYPVGTVGRDMAGCMFTNYLLTYVLFTKTLTSVQFACISVIMVAARVFDAFNDPIMGNVVEATRTRWGKFKPWIAIGGVLSVIVFITSFSTTLQGWAYVAAFGLLYFAYSVVFTMNDIAYWGMVPALARRADDRNRLTSRTVLFAGVGQFLGGIVVPTFTAGSLVIGGNAVTAYRAVVLIVCAAFTATQLITLLVVREPSARDEAPAEKVGIRKAFSTIARNDQLVWCAVVFLIFSVAQTLMGGGLSVTYLYFEFGYNGLLLSIFSILGNVAGAVLMLVFAALSGRFTRAQLMKAGAFGAAAGYLCIMLSGLFIPREMWALKFTMLTVSNLFAFLGQTLVYLIMIICIANTVEYNEWKNGPPGGGHRLFRAALHHQAGHCAGAASGACHLSGGGSARRDEPDLRSGERGLPGAGHHSGKDGTNRGGAGLGAQRQKRRAAGLHDGHPGGASVGCLFHLPCQIYDHGRIL